MPTWTCTNDFCFVRHSITIQDKYTNPISFLFILQEPENVIDSIYHYCLEVCQLVLLIKSTLIVLMVSEIILNSTCWPAMKIAVKPETATYALKPALKLACLSSSLLFIYYTYIFISCIVYHLFCFISHIYSYHVLYTIYFVSYHIIAYAHVYYSPTHTVFLIVFSCTRSCLLFTYTYCMFNSVFLHMLMFIIHLHILYV